MKEKITINVDVDMSKALKRLQREEKVQAMREGRRQRATVFADRRKQASKKACRGKVQW
tara:strand:- start:117 stop:293 length:177 start_codon:yes stop_codon:yes gene_type:complete